MCEQQSGSNAQQCPAAAESAQVPKLRLVCNLGDLGEDPFSLKEACLHPDLPFGRTSAQSSWVYREIPLSQILDHVKRWPVLILNILATGIVDLYLIKCSECDGLADLSSQHIDDLCQLSSSVCGWLPWATPFASFCHIWISRSFDSENKELWI